MYSYKPFFFSDLYRTVFRPGVGAVCGCVGAPPLLVSRCLVSAVLVSIVLVSIILVSMFRVVP